jgi:diguanylate cyclase (GGDEF)-like protein
LSISNQQEICTYQAKILDMQARDSLTGLYNRNHFFQLTNTEFKKKRRDVVKALLYIRPDRFSAIDERLGPTASDALLRALGLLVAEKAGKPSVVARFGGNIFTLLVVRRNLAEIQTLAETLRKSISTSVFAAGKQSTNMTASIGVIELTEAVRDSNHALSLAQSAAAEARKKGGDQVALNESLEGIRQGKLQDAGWLQKVRRALKNDAFQLVFQPIASLTGATNNSYDVLVRLLDEERGGILPGEFMPAAERSGMMPAIDRWVIRHAFSVSYKRAADGKPSLLFIRVSEPSLLDDTFIEWLNQQVRRYRLPKKSIVLQVSEPVAEQYLSRVKALALVCKKLHLLLCMTNAGAGGNCLQLMKLVPVDFLAIDGSFMEGLKRPGKRAQLNEIVAAAADKKIPTIATRVENASELAALCKMGIDFVLGYHVQEPDETIVDDVLLPNPVS